MKNRKIHILITGEQGGSHSIVVKKRSLQRMVAGFSCLFFLLITLSFLGLQRHLRTRELHRELDRITAELQQLRANKSAVPEALEQRLTVLQKELKEEKSEKEEIVVQFEEQVAQLEQEKEVLLKESLAKLDEKNRKLKAVLDQIGIKVKTKEDSGHSGGPYLERPEDYQKRLLDVSDTYLKALDQLPLGRPLRTEISSRFGYRTDPFNKKKAFHSGLDFRGKRGDKIKATANGKVKELSNDPGYGLTVLIQHGHGYATIFAHLDSSFVKPGEVVKRGQIIGEVGDSGRTTSTHLHYEVLQNGKPIDPMKFVQISSSLIN